MEWLALISYIISAALIAACLTGSPRSSLISRNRRFQNVHLSSGKPAFPSYSGPCAVACNMLGLAGSLEIRVKSALRACKIHSAAAATIVSRAGSNDISSSNASRSAHVGILVPPSRPAFRSRAEKEFRLIHSCFTSSEAVSKVGARWKMISKRQKYKEAYISYLRSHASRMLELSTKTSVQRADSS